MPLFGRHHEVDVEQINVLRGEARPQGITFELPNLWEYCIKEISAKWALEVFPISAPRFEKLKIPGPAS